MALTHLFLQVKLRRIIGAQFVALKINTRAIEAIWSSTGSFSTQSRKACPDAWQHSDHGSRWLATVSQAKWHQAIVV